MAEELFLLEYPGLRPFVLSDVQPTGTRIGGGAYGVVDEVDVPVRAAAKTIHAILQGGHGSATELPKAASEFVNECQLLSKLRHPNIVQFLGVTFFPGSRLPALVMERLLTSLHDLLDPQTPPPHGAVPPLSFFSIVLRMFVLQNVACGLAYLHDRSPPVIHRDLSARNVLLDSEMVAKLGDLGMARIVRERAAATMTKGPGAMVYMPPEAWAPAKSNKEKSKYSVSIDVFSLGVVAIFTIGGVFPCDPLAPNYLNEETGLLVARTELQRRAEYMQNVRDQLRALGQLREDHPLIRLIQKSLHNGPHKRPSIHEVAGLLEEARAGIRDGEIEQNKRQLVQALQTHPVKQNLECVIRDLVTENAIKDSQLKHKEEQLLSKGGNQARETEPVEAQLQLRQKEEQLALTESEKQVRERELAEALVQLRQKEEQLQLSEREKEAQRIELHSSHREKESIRQELARKVAQLQKAEETIMREQQHSMSREMTQLQQPQKSKSFTCHVTGPGLTAATVNHSTHVVVELTDSSGVPLSMKMSVMAQLELVSEDKRASQTSRSTLLVSMMFPSHYEVSYTADSRGQHNLYIQVNDREINGSPFNTIAYPDPRKLRKPVRTMEGFHGPYGIAFNQHQEMIVSSCHGHYISICDTQRRSIRRFGSRGSKPEEMSFPRGIAVDDDDNIYVASDHKLQKFTSSGNFIKCVGQRGSSEGGFNQPQGVTLYINQLYVGDAGNSRIQVFDLNLNFVRSIQPVIGGKHITPRDVKISAAGDMYVADVSSKSVLVLHMNGGLIRSFGEGKLDRPMGLLIADHYLYVSDCGNNSIVVYDVSGKFVKSIKTPTVDGPFGISSCVNGHIYFGNYAKNTVGIF